MVGEAGAGAEGVEGLLQAQELYILKHAHPIRVFNVVMDLGGRITDTGTPNKAGRVVL